MRYQMMAVKLRALMRTKVLPDSCKRLPHKPGYWKIFRASWSMTVMVIALCVSSMAACTAGAGDGNNTSKPDTDKDQPAHCPSETSQSDKTEPVNAPSEGDIELVEEGAVSAEPESSGYGAWAFGAILENTSDMAAYKVEVVFTAKLPNGDLATDARQHKPWKYAEHLTSVAPGQQVGLGFEAPLPADELELDVQLEAAVTVSEWWPMKNARHEFASLTAELDEEQPAGFIAFSVDSEYCEPVPAAVGVVFRNSAGEIIGGGRMEPPWVPSEPFEFKEASEFQPGHTDELWADDFWHARISEEGSFDTKPDLTKTAVFPYVFAGDMAS
jgi:hypothetical protein